MNSHFLSTKQNVGAAGAPEQIRREWRAFFVWYIAMRDEEGKSRELYDELAKRTEKRNNTRQWLSSAPPTTQERETTRKFLVEARVASRAKEEWQRRLNKAGLKMEQWTDITVQENAAVAAALWGGTMGEETEDFTASESSDEIETDFDSESTTSTPSMSSRGPQLWTPPEIARTSDLPLPNVYVIPGSSDVTTKGDDNKPTVSRGPPIPTLRPNHRQDTNKPVRMRSTEVSAEEQLTQKNSPPALEALQPDVTAFEAWLEAPTRLEEDRDSRKSWSDDDRTLLATSTDVTDDEFYEIDEEGNRTTPEYQKIPLYNQWTVQQSASKAGATKPNTNIRSGTSPRTGATTIQPSTQTKASNQPNTLKAPVKTYPIPHTSIQTYKVTIPASTITPNAQESQVDRKSALRKQIEEILMPLVIEAKERLQQKLTEAQADAVSCDKFTKEHQDTLKSICRTADKLYHDQIEHERQQLAEMHGVVEHPSPEGITKQQSQPSTSDLMHEQKREPGSSPKAQGSSEELDRSPRAANATKPSPPLTPPHTPQPGTCYIGPVLTDEEKKDEAAAFDNFTLAARKQKIREFHEEAQIMEFELAEQFHTNKPDKKAIWETLKRHDQAMEELRKVKEQERKDLCVAERKRRVAEIEARAREKESGDQNDIPAQPSRRQRSNSFQQQRKEDEMITQTRWRLARADASGVPETSRGQTTAGRAANTQNHNAASRQQPTGSAKDKFTGVRARADHPPTEKAEGLSGLLFVGSVDRRGKSIGPDAASVKTSRVGSITPLSPTVQLPKIYSDTEDDDDDEAEFFTPHPNTKIHKRVRFRPSVQVEDNDVDSSDTDRPVANSLGLGAGSGPYVARRQWTMPLELDSGEGTSKGAVVGAGKTTVVGLKQLEERNIEIWHPPADKQGKGKGKEVPLDSPAQYQDA